MRVVFPLMLLVWCAVFDHVCCHGSLFLGSQASSLINLRGGKKPVSRATARFVAKDPQKPRIVKSPNREDFNADNNIPEEDGDYRQVVNSAKFRRSRTIQGKRSKTSKHSKALIPWATTIFPSKRKFSFLKEGLNKIAKTSSVACKDIYRRAKILKSSTFEGMLLKATWPGNEPVSTEMLTQIIKYSIPAFKYSQLHSDDDPYHMTLHKLWTKMTESDWRSVTKSLIILHSISRDCSVEACHHFSAAIKDLSRTRNPKQTNQKYFDIKVISAVDDQGEPYEPFIQQYATYVLHRVKSFSGKFDELKLINAASSEKQVVATLKKLIQLLQHGINIIVDKNERNAITGQVMKLLVGDIKDSWKFVIKATDRLIANNETLRFSSPHVTKEEVADLLTSIVTLDGEIKVYLNWISKSFSKSHFRITTDMETLSNSVVEQIEKLKKFKGGFTREENEQIEESYENEDDEEDEVEPVDDGEVEDSCDSDDAEGDDDDDDGYESEVSHIENEDEMEMDDVEESMEGDDNSAEMVIDEEADESYEDEDEYEEDNAEDEE